MPEYVYYLPHWNASLNGISGCLLVLGYRLIRQGRERAHRWTMLTSFAVSVLFLVSYLVYHSYARTTRFPAYPPVAVRYFYFGLLASHVVLAAAVPFLAVATIVLALRDRRASHRRLARWTLPIWLYVSVTGVVVYWMLYHLYPPTVSTATMGLDVWGI